MATHETNRWPLLTRLEPDVLASALTASEPIGLPIGFSTDDPNRLGAIQLNLTTVERGEGLGRFILRGETTPPGYDVVVVINPLSADGSEGTIELRASRGLPAISS